MDSPLITSPSTTLDALVSQYQDTLSSLLNTHAPVITKEVQVRPNTPWFCEAIQAAKRERRKAERRWCKNKLTVHLKLLQEARREVNRVVKEAKVNYYQGHITEHSNNQKALFKMSKTLLHRNKTVTLPTHDDPTQLANRFAQFFTDKIDRIRQIFPSDTTSTTPSSHPPTSVPKLSDFRTVTIKEMKKVIREGNSKSCGLDPIPTTLLKDCLDILSPVLTKIVNTSISSTTFPTSFKHASVTPLIKKPSLDCETVSNYRPVSNLPYVGKLIERVVVDQMKEHLERHSLNQPLQSAYRSHHSTETALMKVVNDLHLAVDNKHAVFLVMLDLSAAFDTVNHAVLLQRLEQDFGMEDSVLAWLRSYFSDRVQAVSINGSMSEPQPLKTGMPQGSILGPFSFPQYTAPLFNIVQSNGCEVHMYADDTQVYLSFSKSNSQQFLDKLEHCISEVRQWMNVNFLKLNDSKTEFLIVQSRRSKPVDVKSMNIGDECVIAVPSARNIGAVVDKNLTMEEQVSNVCRNCYLGLRQISQIRCYLTVEATATLAHALIISKLDCYNGLLIGIPDWLIRKLQLIQNNTARLVTKTKKFDNITCILKELHWLPVSFRIEYKVLVLCYKSLNNLSPSYMSAMLEYRDLPSDRCTLRNDTMHLLKEPVARLKSHGDRAFSVYAPRLWNELPLALRLSGSLDCFKKNLKTRLFKKAFDHVSP